MERCHINMGKEAFLTNRYLPALVTPVLPTCLIDVTWPLFHPDPIGPYLLVVIACAWYGGFMAGLLSAMISFALAHSFFIGGPHFGNGLDRLIDELHLFTFLSLAVTCALSYWLIALQQKSMRFASIDITSKRLLADFLPNKDRLSQLLESPSRRSLTEEALARAAAIVESSHDAILSKTLDGIITSWNAGAANIYGYSPEEILGRSISVLIPPDCAEDLRNIMTKVRKGDTVDHYETLRVRKDGQRIYVSVTVSPIRDAGGVITGASAIARDVTVQKATEINLRRAEAQLAEAQRLASIGSWNWDIENDTHTWSEELYRIYGLPKQNTSPSYESFFSLVVPADRETVERVVDEAIKTQQPIDCYVRIIQPGGSERIIHSCGTTITDSKGTPVRIHGSVQDVTRWKQAEDALREAERKYRNIFENAGEGIFQSLPDGRYISANPKLADIYGFLSAADLIESCKNASYQPHVDPARHKEFKRQIEELGAVRDFEYEVFRKDGSGIWISVNARVVRDAQGIIEFYEGTARDITEGKFAREALRDSEQRYRELFENATDANYVHDLTGKYTSVNRAAEKLTGYTREELLGRNFIEFVPPEQVANIRDHLCRKLKEQIGTTYESEIITKDGRRLPVDVSSHLILENNVPIGVAGAARDITERKRAEQMLGEYEKAVENLDEMIVVIDRDYRYRLANRAFLKFRELEIDHLLGRHVSEILGPAVFESIAREKLDQCFEGNVVRYELKVTYPNLGERDLFVSYFPIENGTGIDRVACVLKDITESKQTEARLRAKREQLRALSARLHSAREEEGTRIAREIHDELGSALTSVRWDLEVADKILAGPVDPMESAALRERLRGLVKLTDSAINSIRRIAAELRPRVLDDLGLVAAIEWQAQQFQARTGIVCHCDCSIAEVKPTEEQSTALFRILQEALTNVLRHARATRVDIKIELANNYFILSIRDNGKGISAKEKSGQHSLGILGMRERAHLIGGEVNLQGMEKKGTVVTVQVPMKNNRVRS